MHHFERLKTDSMRLVMETEKNSETDSLDQSVFRLDDDGKDEFCEKEKQKILKRKMMEKEEAMMDCYQTQEKKAKKSKERLQRVIARNDQLMEQNKALLESNRSLEDENLAMIDELKGCMNDGFSISPDL